MAELLYIVQNPDYPDEALPTMEDFVEFVRGQPFKVWVQRSDHSLHRLVVLVSTPDSVRFSFGMGEIMGRDEDTYKRGTMTETFELKDARIMAEGDRRRLISFDKLVLHHEATPGGGGYLPNHGFIDPNAVTLNILFPGEGGGWSAG